MIFGLATRKRLVFAQNHGLGSDFVGRPTALGKGSTHRKVHFRCLSDLRTRRSLAGGTGILGGSRWFCAQQGGSGVTLKIKDNGLSRGEQAVQRLRRPE
jgi:hypothetical protein